MSCTLEVAIQSCDTGQRIPFSDSCQLTTTWMSAIKLNTDGICLGHLANLANNTPSLQENLARSATNQRARTIVAM